MRASDVLHAVATDLVAEYIETHNVVQKDVILRLAIRMGVKPLFDQILKEVRNE